MDVHPSLLRRKIIHVDMDCFYAAVEMLDDPSLRGRPVIVGGSPESRGVVSTANYEARKFGVHSAMPTSRAYRLCPHGVFLRPRFDRYREVSEQIRSVFRRYTDKIEPLSLDEAYLDVTGNPQGLLATEIARRIKREIREVTGGLTASAGVAPNKLLAKIASDFQKPDGLTVVTPERAAAFMRDLPVRKIHGIGPKSAERLAKDGIKTCRDALELGKEKLFALYGDFGHWLFERAQGLDDREVVSERAPKSIGRESTYPVDLVGLEVMDQELDELAVEVSSRLKESEVKGKTVTVKVRYDDFTSVTRATTLVYALDDASTIGELARTLLRRTEAATRPVRLLGIQVSKLTGPENDAVPRAGWQQGRLFPD